MNLLPVLAGHHRARRQPEFWADWRRLTRPAGWLGALLFWGVFWTAPDILRLAFGPGHVPSATVFRLYALALPLRALAVNIPLRATGSPRAEMGAGLALGLVNLFLGLAVGSRLGLAGPALGVLAGLYTWGAWVLLATAARLRVAPYNVLPFASLGTSLAVTGGLALLVGTTLAPSLGGPSSGRLAAFWGTYAVVALGGWLLSRLLRGTAGGADKAPEIP